VEIRTINNPHVHAKLVIVDGLRAYVGSVNMSSASMDQNREAGILVSQDDIIDRLNQSFEQDWNRGTPAD
jgi:phosphatidylserine/phosphatidylglycerophosphate/cardiolipin synthase-like enzyme